MIDIQGRCPACRWQSLFLGDGGHVTCSRLECLDPCAADQLLHGENGPAATQATEPAVVDRQTAVVLAALHRSAEADVSRVIDLYERWVKVGPPPLGTSVSRWWDKRLVELHAALNPKGN